MEDRPRTMGAGLAFALVLPLCLLGTGVASYAVFQSSKARDQVRFRSAAQWTTDAIRQRLDVYAGLLRGTAGLFSATHSPDVTSFSNYVSQLEPARNYKGVQGFGWAEKLQQGGLAAMHERLRTAYGTNIFVVPGGDRHESYPIVYLQPLDARNQRALGYDMFSEPMRNEAMARARDTGTFAASGKVTLVQEIEELKQAGFLLYLPVYSNGAAPQSVEARRREIQGFVYSPFRADDLFSGIFFAEQQPLLSFEVYDGGAVNPSKLLHRSVIQPADEPQFKEETLVYVGGRPWRILFRTSEEFEMHSDRLAFLWVLTTGLLISGVITGITYSLAKARERSFASEAEATRQRERYRVTLASIGDAVIACDAKKRVVFMNRAAEQCTGWILEQAAKEPAGNILRLSDEESGEPIADLGHAAIERRRHSEIARAVLTTKDGVKLPVEGSASPILGEQGALSGVVFVFRDVTQSRAAEEARSRLAAIVESTDDAVLSQDMKGNITTWNAGAERLFGYPASEIVGRHISILMPPDRMDEDASLLATVHKGHPISHFETIRVGKDGRLVEVALSISPLRDHSGTVVGSAKIARDITERKAAERKLREAQEALKSHAENLEKTVADRTTKLREIIGELEAFSYSLSHDMRTPLRSIQSYSQFLLSDFAEHLEPRAVEFLKKIVASVRRMDRLISDVLSLTRISRQHMTIGPVALHELVEDLINNSSELQEPRADVKIEGELPVVLGHEASLNQCFSNLLGNAAKFVARGVHPQIRVFARVDGDRATIYVQDNGIGIAPEAQEKVFEMFARHHTTGSYEGTGLGLAIVRKAVERMNGTVGLESHPGRGSTFRVELPSAAWEPRRPG